MVDQSSKRRSGSPRAPMLVLVLLAAACGDGVYDDGGLDTCGDGVIDPGEVCDGDDLGGETCESLGFEGGDLACREDCSDFDVSGCLGEAPHCGNDLREGDEVCDGTDLAGESCQSLGYEAGVLACLPDCTGFDTSGCHDLAPVCGNDLREGDEVCDGTDLAGESCQSLGYDEGALACLPDCSGFDTSGCAHESPAGPAGTCGSGGATGSWQQVDLDAQGHYLIRAPQGEAPLPMIMIFHGDDGNVNTVLSYWDPVQAANQSFILVGMKCPGCDSFGANPSVSEEYIWDVLADVSSRYDIDVSRIYASGYSGGANMLASLGLRFQGVFAGLHLNCGGGNYTGTYHSPPRSDCKVPARFVVSESDFLYDIASSTASWLEGQGHHVDFVTPSCSGHCCYVGPVEAAETLAWFQERTKCGGIVPGSCAAVTALP